MERLTFYSASLRIKYVSKNKIGFAVVLQPKYRWWDFSDTIFC